MASRSKPSSKPRKAARRPSRASNITAIEIDMSKVERLIEGAVARQIGEARVTIDARHELPRGLNVVAPPAPAAAKDSPVFGQIGTLSGRQGYSFDLLNEMEDKLKPLLLPPNTNAAGGTVDPVPATTLGSFLGERISDATKINERLRDLIERIVL